METVTTILQRLRSAGLTQCEISRRTGIPQPRLSRWEGSSAPVGANDALRLQALLAALAHPEPKEATQEPSHA